MLSSLPVHGPTASASCQNSCSSSSYNSSRCGRLLLQLQCRRPCGPAVCRLLAPTTAASTLPAAIARSRAGQQRCHRRSWRPWCRAAAGHRASPATAVKGHSRQTAEVAASFQTEHFVLFQKQITISREFPVCQMFNRELNTVFTGFSVVLVNFNAKLFVIFCYKTKRSHVSCVWKGNNSREMVTSFLYI